jgi:hypothetical protein
MSFSPSFQSFASVIPNRSGMRRPNDRSRVCVPEDDPSPFIKTRIARRL